MGFTGVLMDTVSIQKFIFSSNRLKENIGGSYLVEQVFDRYLKEALLKVIPQLDLVSVESWGKKPDTISILDNQECLVEPAYIGGGNALLLFRDLSNAKAFVKTWTRLLLQVAPGLQTAVAIGDFDPAIFSDSLDHLFEMLHKNKNQTFPITEFPKFGITADCPLSNLSAETPDSDDKKIWISSVSHARKTASEEAVRALNDEWMGHNPTSQWRFTNEIDQLGQKGESHDQQAPGYIAVVHIDGNNMGKQFSKCTSIPEYRKLSRFIAEQTRRTFWKMTEALESISPSEYLKERIFIAESKEGHTIFPMRPIVIGGDDITFICHAKIALMLTKVFLTHWVASNSERPLSACAGIAIAKTKYPFYQAYQFAEDLCSEAKANSRKLEDSSWVSFYIHQSGTTGDLSAMRGLNAPFGKDSSAFFGPYFFHSHDGNHRSEDQSLSKLEEGIDTFSLWPRTKLMGLRTALLQGKLAYQDFVKREELRGIQIPKISYATTGYEVDGWANRSTHVDEHPVMTTPYLDMIDMIDVHTDFARGGDEA